MNSNVATKANRTKPVVLELNRNGFSSKLVLTKKKEASIYRAAARAYETGEVAWRKGSAGNYWDRHPTSCAVGGLWHQLYRLGVRPSSGVGIGHGHGHGHGVAKDMGMPGGYGLVGLNDHSGTTLPMVILAMREIAYRLEHGGNKSPSFGGPKYKRKSRSVEVTVNVLP